MDAMELSSHRGGAGPALTRTAFRYPVISFPRPHQKHLPTLAEAPAPTDSRADRRVLAGPIRVHSATPTKNGHTRRHRRNTVRRENGNPKSLGSWHASALTCMTISGGKKTRASASWPSLESGQSLLKKAFAPFRYNLPREVETAPDILVGAAIGSKEDNLGSYDITIR